MEEPRLRSLAPCTRNDHVDFAAAALRAKPGAHANRVPSSRRRSAEAVRQDRARPDGGNHGTTLDMVRGGARCFEHRPRPAYSTNRISAAPAPTPPVNRYTGPPATLGSTAAAGAREWVPDARIFAGLR